MSILLLFPVVRTMVWAQAKGKTVTVEDQLDLDQDLTIEDENVADDSQLETPQAVVKPQTNSPQKQKTDKTVQPTISNQNNDIHFLPIDDNGNVVENGRASVSQTNKNKKDDLKEVKLARTAFHMKKYAEAESLFWKNIEKLSLLDMKMMMYSSDKIGKTSEALKAAKLILGKTGDDADAYTVIGRTHAQKTTQKDSERLAIENLKKAIEVSPKFEPAYLALASFYEKKITALENRMQSRKKNYYELRLLYQEMYEKFPAKAAYASQVCKIDALDEQLDQAKESCRKAMIANPKDPIGYVYLGIAFQKAKDENEAKRILAGAVKRFKNSDLANITWAKYLESQGNFVDAFNYFKTATKLNSQNADAWIGLARTGVQLSKEEDSLAAFRKACSLNPLQAGVDLRKAYGYAKKLKTQFELLDESCR